MTNLIRIATILAASAVCALAADISGKWTGQVPRGGNTIDTTFEFKVSGETLTGTVSDSNNTMKIEDGKVSGGSVTFTVETQRGKRTFKGTVSGTEIKFRREGGQNASEFTAKRAGS